MYLHLPHPLEIKPGTRVKLDFDSRQAAVGGWVGDRGRKDVILVTCASASAMAAVARFSCEEYYSGVRTERE